MISRILDERFISPDLRQQTVENESIKRFVGRSLSFRTYRSAVIYPGKSKLGSGGIVDACGHLVENTSVFNGCTQAGALPGCDIENSDDSVVYLGMLYGCWGHCLTDCLQRMWVIGNTDKKLVYTTSDWRRGLPENFFALLSAIGLKREQMIEVSRPTRFREVIVPDSCFYTNLNVGHIEYTNEYVQLFDRLRLAGVKAPWRHVYFSRTCWNDGTNFGEKLFEPLFANRGYEVIYPERLSFDELRKLMSETKELVATEGSCAHNSIFMPKGARVVIIRKAAYMNRWQPVINEMLDMEPVYIDANFSHLLFNRKYPTLGPFFMYVNGRMANFLGCEAHFPFKEYLRYVACFLRVKWRGFINRVWKLWCMR